MRLTKDQQSVQALAAHGADQAFRIAILPRRSRRDRSVADIRTTAALHSFPVMSDSRIDDRALTELGVLAAGEAVAQHTNDKNDNYNHSAIMF